MSYLVDANVLSEATKPTPDARVMAWLRQNERDLVVDPVIVGEIRFEILLMPAGRRRKRLEVWFEEGVRRMACLTWDVAVGLRWAKLLADLRATGRSMPIKDSLVAATALPHDLVIVTRNRRDFESAGVQLVDPFAQPQILVTFDEVHGFTGEREMQEWRVVWIAALGDDGNGPQCSAERGLKVVRNQTRQ